MPHSTSRSLVPAFATDRDVSLAVKLASELALVSPISIRIEPTFERLRYHLGGDRPSQTAHLTLSPWSIETIELEPQNQKGGISLFPLSRPKARLQRVPPILRI